MSRPMRYVGQRAGWIVLADRAGALWAEEVGDKSDQRYPVAPIVSVGRDLVVECPTCPPTPRSKRPRRHHHGILGERGALGEGHRIAHCPTPSPDYVVLLLDAESVEIRDLPSNLK